jgi:WD repeat-containing protein 19
LQCTFAATPPLPLSLLLLREYFQCRHAARAPAARALQARSCAAIELAIEVAGQLRSETISAQVADAIEAVAEGPQREELRFRLNIALGQFVEAARDAVELARFEQVGQATAAA